MSATGAPDTFVRARTAGAIRSAALEVRPGNDYGEPDRTSGPGASLALGEEQFELVRRYRFRVVSDGGPRVVVHHVVDAGEATEATEATVATVGRGGRGAYNVVDDEPAPDTPSGEPAGRLRRPARIKDPALSVPGAFGRRLLTRSSLSTDEWLAVQGSKSP